MSTNDPSTPPAGGPGQPSEAELMAAYEEQMKNVRVEEVVVQSLASFIELGGRRAGLVPGAQEEADTAQLGVAIEAIRALQPVVAPLLGPNAGQVDQALSQLQLAYAQQTGGSGGGDGPDGGSGGPGGPGGSGGPGGPGGPGPGGPGAQPKGGQGGPSRLWVPGQ